MWLFSKKIISRSLFLAAFVWVNKGFAQNETEKSGIAQVTVENYSGQQDNNWVELQKDLGVLKTKLDAQQGIVKELLDSKKNNKGPISKDQVDQLGSHDKKLQELTKEYNLKLNEFELKYPEKGQALGRQYSRKKNLQLDPAVEKAELSSRVIKINKKIRTQYRTKIDTSSTNQDVPITQIKKTSEAEAKKTNPHDVTDKITVVK